METIKINNEPIYARNYEFIVVREVDNEYWFYGAYSNGFLADNAASEIHGIVIHNVRIQGKKKSS